jgi:hypothetical protein
MCKARIKSGKKASTVVEFSAKKRRSTMLRRNSILQKLDSDESQAIF